MRRDDLSREALRYREIRDTIRSVLESSALSLREHEISSFSAAVFSTPTPVPKAYAEETLGRKVVSSGVTTRFRGRGLTRDSGRGNLGALADGLDWMIKQAIQAPSGDGLLPLLATAGMSASRQAFNDAFGFIELPGRRKRYAFGVSVEIPSHFDAQTIATVIEGVSLSLREQLGVASFWAAVPFGEGGVRRALRGEVVLLRPFEYRDGVILFGLPARRFDGRGGSKGRLISCDGRRVIDDDRVLTAIVRGVVQTAFEMASRQFDSTPAIGQLAAFDGDYIATQHLGRAGFHASWREVRKDPLGVSAVSPENDSWRGELAQNIAEALHRIGHQHRRFGCRSREEAIIKASLAIFEGRLMVGRQIEAEWVGGAQALFDRVLQAVRTSRSPVNCTRMPILSLARADVAPTAGVIFEDLRLAEQQPAPAVADFRSTLPLLSSGVLTPAASLHPLFQAIELQIEGAGAERAQRLALEYLRTLDIVSLFVAAKATVIARMAECSTGKDAQRRMRAGLDAILKVCAERGLDPMSGLPARRLGRRRDGFTPLDFACLHNSVAFRQLARPMPEDDLGEPAVNPSQDAAEELQKAIDEDVFCSESFERTLEQALASLAP